jgi:hypothetical protein
MYETAHLTIVIVLAILGTIHVGLISYLIGYLRAAHEATWIELGQPSMWRISGGWPRDSGSWLRLTGFLFFSNRYARLNDARLSKLIWAIRILGIVAMCEVIVSLRLH